MSRATGIDHPAQHLRGVVGFRGRYVCPACKTPHEDWYAGVFNAHSGLTINSDGPYRSMQEAIDDAAYRTSIAREAWMFSFTRKVLK